MNPYGITEWMWFNGFTELCDIVSDPNYDFNTRVSCATVVKIWKIQQRLVVGNPNPGYPPYKFWMDRMVDEYLSDRPGFAAPYNAAPQLSPYYVPTF